jgi:hypothetical protein
MNFFYRAVAKYAYNRLCEASTWRNMILLIGGSWASANPTTIDGLVPVLLALVGFIGTFLPDALGVKKNELPAIELQSPAPDIVWRTANKKRLNTDKLRTL